jgi:hypothetical protein
MLRSYKFVAGGHLAREPALREQKHGLLKRPGGVEDASKLITQQQANLANTGAFAWRASLSGCPDLAGLADDDITNSPDVFPAANWVVYTPGHCARGGAHPAAGTFLGWPEPGTSFTPGPDRLKLPRPTCTAGAKGTPSHLHGGAELSTVLDAYERTDNVQGCPYSAASKDDGASVREKDVPGGPWTRIRCVTRERLMPEIAASYRSQGNDFKSTCKPEASYTSSL